MNFIPELTFVAYLLMSQASPGPDQTLVTRTSLAHGLKAGVAVSLGIATGAIFQAALACTVGSALLQSAWGSLFYYLAGCWMVYLAWKIWPKKGAFVGGDATEEAEEPSLSRWGLYRDAMICNVTNPKCTLFFMSLSAPLLNVPHSAGYTVFVVALTVVTCAIGWILWAWAFQWAPVRCLYAKYTVAIDRIFALALLLFGLLLFTSKLFMDNN
ncbi:LysE family translocator [Akkermansia sp. N21116]|uniref:LysE family translocator n=1 Tax=Akkermansia sp. N21116 TaxID=3040764 RepID=UPI00244EECDD|nr:LysE family translocator [Akkermansia sp. N21116]WPX41697.1 LysE family translocator [Akkermansia sp. N21116]